MPPRGPGLALRLVPVVIWVDWMTILVATGSRTGRFLPPLDAVVTGFAKRLVIFRIPKYSHVTPVRHDVVNDAGCGQFANLFAVTAERMLIEEPDAILLPTCAIAALSCTTAISGGVWLSHGQGIVALLARCWMGHFVPHRNDKAH